MTVQTQTNRASYDGNGATTAFTVPFRFLANAHVRAVLRAPDGTETPWAETTNYTLTGAGEDAGGTLTALVAPAAGEKLVIVRNVPVTQEIDYVEGEPFPAETHEKGLDKLTMIAQQILEQQNRVLSLPVTDDSSVVFPTSTERAGKYLAFDSGGAPVAASDPSAIVVTPFGEQVVNAGDAAAARDVILPPTTAADHGRTLVVNSVGDDYVLAGPLRGFRNALINGGFDVWQRETSFSIGASASAYTADRAFANGGVGGVFTVSRQAFTPGQTDVPGNPTWFYRASLTTASTASGWPYMQKIENVFSFAGEKAAYSFYARVASGTATFTPSISQAFGTGGSDPVVTAGTPVTVTTSWQRFTGTFDVPGITGKIVGANSSLDFFLAQATGDTYTLDLAQVQFEAGPVATPFERRPVGIELALCQRYYEIIPTTHVGTLAGAQYVIQHTHFYKVSKRVAPTVTLTTGGIHTLGGSPLPTNIIESNIYGFSVRNNGTSASTDWYIDGAADAEL